MKRKSVSAVSVKNGLATTRLNRQVDSPDRVRELARRLGELVRKALADRATADPDTNNPSDEEHGGSGSIALRSHTSTIR